MVKLRHITGDNIVLLERELEKIKLPIVIQEIKKLGATWYIFFLVQGVHEEKQDKIMETTKKTTTKRPKKKASRNG